MTKLRRSRFAKFIAVFLTLILSASVIFNIIGAVILMEENLYYASYQQIQQKVFSYLYDYTASDLMQYLGIVEDVYTNRNTYQNYNQSELELYRSKYSSENSNIYFEIRDEYGNIILRNDSIISDEAFSFSSSFTTFNTETMYFDGWYKVGGSDVAEIIPQASDYFPGSITESTTYIDSYEEETETVLPYENMLPSDDSPAVVDNSTLNCETVTVDNDYSGNSTEMSYYYTGEIDQQIFSYCTDITRLFSYDITDIAFYQSEYYISDYDETLRVYSPNDTEVPAKSIKTKLLCDDKEVSVTYSYNGSFYASEFENRLAYVSLIARNINENNLNFSYHQKGKLQIQVSVFVPYSCNVSDIYSFAEKLVDIALFYRNNLIPITVFDIAVVIICLIFLFWSAGYIPNRKDPVARGLHGIPLDLYVVISAAAAVGCVALICTVDELFVILGFIGCAFILISLIYTLPVRIRTKTVKTNNLFYKIYRSIKNASHIIDESAGSRLRVFLTLSLFLIISAFEVIYFVAMGCAEAALFIFIVRLLETPVIAFLVIALIALHNGAKAISKGDVSYRVKESFLFGPLKTHAEYLNSINDAVNSAVAERMKSESLKTELITNVSHDLKTPLTSIVNYVDLLKKENIDNPKAIEYIEVIDRQSQRLKKLTVDIVEASKAATGNIEVHYEKTVLNVILLQTNGEYIERLEEKSLTLVPEIPDKNIVVSTDGRLLWRVIDNLMNNICKYSMPGTRVYLTLHETDGKAYISFRNISREKLDINPDTLTERFVRGDTSRNTEGSGLGLSIANSFTEILGGSLSIVIDGDLFKATLIFPVTDDK